MLKLTDVSAGHPRRPLAVQQVSMRVASGERVGVIGTNGSGKSELLQAIAGLIPLKQGSVTLHSRRIDKLAPHRVASEGIALVPEGRHIFRELSVHENLAIAIPRGAKHRLEKMWNEFPILHERRHHPAAALSGGEQQQLAIARALIVQPSVLLLDEPSAGLSPLLVETVYRKLASLTHGLSLVIVEQIPTLLAGRVDRVYVMRGGRIIAELTPEQLSDSDYLQLLYFGDGQRDGRSAIQG